MAGLPPRASKFRSRRNRRSAEGERDMGRISMRIPQARIAAQSGVAILALAWAGVAAAQETPATPDADPAVAATGPTTATEAPGKDIIITGSRIRGAAPVGS